MNAPGGRRLWLKLAAILGNGLLELLSAVLRLVSCVSGAVCICLRLGGLLDASAIPLAERPMLLPRRNDDVDIANVDFFAVCWIGELDLWGVNESCVRLNDVTGVNVAYAPELRKGELCAPAAEKLIDIESRAPCCALRISFMAVEL